MGIGEVSDRLRKSTVHVRSGNGRHQSTGSGIIWDSAGVILTNAHVLGRGDEIQIDLDDGRSFPAKLAARDTARDLAKLTINTFALNAISQRGTPVRPGELAIAVGNPMGFTGAFSQGTVHTIGPFPGLGRRRIWIQSAVRLAPGNSGGPLADAQGRLIGVNTMITSTGIALAIPATEAHAFIKRGAAPRLGVSVRPTPLGRRVGLLLLDVEAGSLAEHASLLLGDLLTGANGQPFESSADLSDAIAESAATGRAITLRFLRGDRSKEREVTILTGEAAAA